VTNYPAAYYPWTQRTVHSPVSWDFSLYQRWLLLLHGTHNSICSVYFKGTIN